MKRQCSICLSAMGILALSGAALAQDGMNLGAGQSLRATQDTPTGFGNAIGGGQDSAGGSELNQMWGDISGGTLTLSLSGNLEANFNKLWIFIDAVGGGENTLANDNNDGGFGEINNMAGLTFDSGFEPDHGFRIEVGNGFGALRFFDLIDNSAGDVWTFGGPGDLPAGPNAGGFGTTWGWDNSNVLGVDVGSAAGAATATKGIELSIDMFSAFGEVPSSVKVTAFISNDGGNFLSNQVLPGVGGLGNLGDPTQVNFNNIVGDQCVVIPAPGSIALLGLGGLAAIRRRRA